MKKILIIGLCLLAAAVTVWGFLSLRNAALSEETDLCAALPRKPDLLVEIHQPGQLSQSLLYNNGYWQYWRQNPELQLLGLILAETDSAREAGAPITLDRPMQLAVFFEEQGSVSVLGARISADEWQYWSKRLSHYPKLQRRYLKGVMLASYDSTLLAQAAESLDNRRAVMESDTAFNTLRQTIGVQAAMSAFIRHESLNRLLSKSMQSPCPELKALLREGIEWSALDFEIRERQLVLSGFALPDSKSSDLERLRRQTPAANSLEDALPANTYYYRHQAAGDLEAYRTAGGQLPVAEDSMWRCADGSGTLAFFRQYFDGQWLKGLCPEGQFVVVRLSDAEAAAKDLHELADSLHASHDNGGYRFGLCGFAASVLGPDAMLQREFVSLHGDNLWITDQAGLAATIAAGPKLTDDPAYKNTRGQMQTESAETRYYRLPVLLSKLDSRLSDNWAGANMGWLELLCPFGSLTAQSEYSSGGLTYRNITANQADRPLALKHRAELACNGYTAQAGEPAGDLSEAPAAAVEPEPQPETAPETETAAEPVAEPTPEPQALLALEKAFEVKLDAAPAMRPQVFKNHLNGENEIVVQDSKKQLYLISAKGQIIWKIQLSEFILGDVFAVDMLSNKKWQMTFVTPSKWFVIDRKGNNLAGFPIVLNPQASAGLQVVDYENKADYRFFIPRKGGKVNLLKKDGRQPQDWAFKPTGKDVQQAVQHFSAGGKDFLVCTGAEASQVVDRRGRTRISTDGITGWSQNPLTADGSGSTYRMAGSAPNGDLQFVYADGRSISVPVEAGMAADHAFALLAQGTAKRYLLADKNGLKVYNEDFELVRKADLRVEGALQTLGSRAFYYYAAARQLGFYDADDGKTHAAVACDSPYFTVCTLKPYSGKCLTTTDANKLVVYQIRP